MKGFVYSHKGLVRKVNEDSGCFVSNNNGDYMMAIADGMGGHNGGEYASRITIDYIFRKFIQLDIELTIRDYIFWIDNLLNETNKILKNVGKKNSWLEDMGTTIVIAIKLKNKTLIINVGDSRCYAIKSNQLKMISEDHTFVNLMYKQGIYTLDEIENHPRKHVITQALGNETNVEPNYKVIYNDEYDALLLATDGLTDLVNDNELRKIISHANTNYSKIGNALMNRALDLGGKDNVTLGLLYQKEKNDK